MFVLWEPTKTKMENPTARLVPVATQHDSLPVKAQRLAQVNYSAVHHITIIYEQISILTNK